MTKRRATVLAIGGMLVIALLVGSLWHSDLIGWWWGETKYKGRYTNSWRTELRQWLRAPDGGSFWMQRKKPEWIRPRFPVEQWLEKTLKVKIYNKGSSDSPLFRGDPEAVPVLVELLGDPDTKVRHIAMNALAKTGVAGAPAIPLLVAALEDEEISQEAERALRAIMVNVP